MKSLSTSLLISVTLFLAFVIPTSAQKSSADIYKDIKKLGVLANVLYLAAHPDDENTRMISYLSNDLSVNTTYLSLTRGDGGQNLIGPEMREMLGVIRTNELLSARAIDGGSQLFTRANDFGYSKSPAETFTIWDKEDVLSDVVWAIRKVRPDVIINRFTSDTSRPNHGHHTASAILAEEAFTLSADTTLYSDQLAWVKPWQPRRVFWNTSWFFYGSREAFEAVDKSDMIGIDIGAYDPVMGQSCSEIAGRSRSMHKSQGFGAAETRGESFDYLILVEDSENTKPTSLFDDIDISWNRVKGGQKIGNSVTVLEGTFDFTDPAASLPLLLSIYRDIESLQDPFWRDIKLAECKSLIQSCLGLYIEARTNVYSTSPEATLPVTLEVINRSDQNVSLLSVRSLATDSLIDLSEPLLNNQGYEVEISEVVPAHLSIPYWLEEPYKDGMYTVEDQQMRGLPWNPAAMQFEVIVTFDGIPFSFTTDLIYKAVDPAKGEVTRPVSIIPPVTVESKDEVLVFRKGESKQIPLTIIANADAVTGTLQLETEESGWTLSPSQFDLSFDHSGETQDIVCTITPPDKSASATLIPKVMVESKNFHHKTTTLDYDHIPYLSIVREAAIHLQSMDIGITPRRIAYIMGAGDDVPASLRQIGYEVDLIEPDQISTSGLAGYEVVILGVRAFNTVEALAHKNKILFDWTKAGGTMIVQYNVSRRLVTDALAPYPLTLSRDRTTEENAPVSILQKDHPAMMTPNKITAADFDGWVQERGLYYPGEWDEHFTPLLSMHDTGEDATEGALLVAPYGDGYFVYSGLSWFRHLPAGNPGPYRLLSNLISLGYKTDKS